jgi:hypothetical protein
MRDRILKSISYSERQQKAKTLSRRAQIRFDFIIVHDFHLFRFLVWVFRFDFVFKEFFVFQLPLFATYITILHGDGDDMTVFQPYYTRFEVLAKFM